MASSAGSNPLTAPDSMAGETARSTQSPGEQLARVVQPLLAELRRSMSAIADEQTTRALEPIQAMMCQYTDALIGQVGGIINGEVKRTIEQTRDQMRAEVDDLIEPARGTLTRNIVAALDPLVAPQHAQPPGSSKPAHASSRGRTTPSAPHHETAARDQADGPSARHHQQSRASHSRASRPRSTPAAKTETTATSRTATQRTTPARRTNAGKAKRSASATVEGSKSRSPSTSTRRKRTSSARSQPKREDAKSP